MTEREQLIDKLSDQMDPDGARVFVDRVVREAQSWTEAQAATTLEGLVHEASELWLDKSIAKDAQIAALTAALQQKTEEVEAWTRQSEFRQRAWEMVNAERNALRAVVAKVRALEREWHNGVETDYFAEALAARLPPEAP